MGSLTSVINAIAAKVSIVIFVPIICIQFFWSCYGWMSSLCIIGLHTNTPLRWEVIGRSEMNLTLLACLFPLFPLISWCCWLCETERGREIRGGTEAIHTSFQSNLIKKNHTQRVKTSDEYRSKTGFIYSCRIQYKSSFFRTHSLFYSLLYTIFMLPSHSFTQHPYYY